MELNQDLIEEGKALVVKTESAERMTSENRLALGRWALKVYPMQEHGVNRHTSLDRSADLSSLLNEYADAVGIKRSRLDDYRKVANAWGDSPADGLAWSVIRKLCWREDRESYSALVFEKYGKVTEYTIEKYEEWKRETQKRNEQLLELTPETDEDIVEFEDEIEDEVEYIYDPVNPPINTQPRKHGFSAPVRRLFSVVEHVKSARSLLQEESIPSVDYANDEHFEEILSACDTIVTEIMDYREMVVAKRVKAGLSPEVG